MLNPDQHGFQKDRSCLSQLLEHNGNILEDTKDRGNVDVVYLDFVKAFDKIDHDILLHMMRALEICGKMEDGYTPSWWDRQTVSVNGAQ